MRNRASLMLMEQLLMVLVFALAAAICLGIFGKASEISRDTARRERAAILAQNAAELVKAGEDPDTLPVPDGYEVTVVQPGGAIPGLRVAKVTVCYETEELFTIEVAGQEVQP